jgi:hypothetical protein
VPSPSGQRSSMVRPCRPSAAQRHPSMISPTCRGVRLHVQSAFDTFARESFTVHRRKLLDDRRSGPKPHATDEHIADVPLTVTADGRRVWGRFEVAKHKILSDPRWVKAVFAMVHRSLHGRVPFNPQPAVPPALADPARLILIGDWGSGLPRALDVRDQARTSATSITPVRGRSTSIASSIRGPRQPSTVTWAHSRSPVTMTCTRAGRRSTLGRGRRASGIGVQILPPL